MAKALVLSEDTLATPVTQLQDIGTSLYVTPNINADRTVTLRLLQETSSVNVNGATISFPNADGTTTSLPVDTVNRQTVSGTVVPPALLTFFSSSV